ncbi:MAG: type II secretion system protein M [Betaproteobacteria bacterium]|nr:MAG: type II secretion system protein M [Betaproteobacteria bacterium]
MMDRLRTWWTGLARRERIMTITATAVVFLGLLYSLAVEPAWKTRARLAAELPRLQAELVQIEALSAEAKRLDARIGVGQTAEALRDAAEQSIRRANLAANVGSDGENTVTVKATGVSASAWLRWLESFTRETRSAVAAASMQRNGPAGLIDASVSFRTDAR